MKRIWMAGALGAMLLMLAACGAPAEGRGTDPVALGETLLQRRRQSACHAGVAHAKFAC